MKGFIYCITNLINDKKYIGQTVREPQVRWTQHINFPDQRTAIGRAIKKYGKNNFKFNIIDELKTQEVLNIKEEEYICLFNSKTIVHGYNIKNGGSNGKLSKETKEKISKAHIGISTCRLGKKHSIETRREMSKKRVKSGLFGFVGCSYHHKDREPWLRVWRVEMGYNSKKIFLGYFNDPLSAHLVRKMVWDEIYN